MKKKFVLDTNVILTDPKCIYKFEDNDIYIPLIVIEELDGLKKGHSDKSRNARQFSREVDKLRSEGSLSEGVHLKTGGNLHIHADDMHKDSVPMGMNLDVNDDLIIYTAHTLNATLVSKDLNVRLKADAVGVSSEDYKAEKVRMEKDESSTGYRVVRFTSEELEYFRNEKYLPYSEGKYPNEYFIMKEHGNNRNSALGRYSVKKGGIVPLIGRDSMVWGIEAKNAEQNFAVDALLNDEIKMVSLLGKAGTGKTLMAVACGLQKVLEEKVFDRMLISRPVVPMGKDLGYLPGDINEKLDPWMSPIYDNLDLLFGSRGRMNNWQSMVDNGIIKVEALTYIRGRSIPNQYMIVDESQNLSPHELKTIATRIGEGTKLVLTGDTEQIDSAYLDEISNGLTYVVEKLKHEDIVSHVELIKGERSKLADIATKLL